MPDHYCTSADLENRLTLAGMTYVANRDGGKTVSANEIEKYIDSAIQRADAEIDQAIRLHYETSAARGNDWLKFIAVDLATVTAITNGGRGVPEQCLADQQRARKLLDQVRLGVIRIPGLSRRTLQYFWNNEQPPMMFANPVNDGC